MTSEGSARLVRAISIVVFAVGVFRIFALVLHIPVLGYANNYDMIRMQACLQIWPADPSIPAGGASPAAPIDEYQSISMRHLAEMCIPSSELIFGYLGKLVVHVLGAPTFSVSVFGMVRALAISAVALSFLLALLRFAAPAAALVHSLIFLLVIADPANTLYFNTFYTGFSALFFAYTSFLLAWYICLRGESLFLSLSLAATLLLLGLVSRQYVLLPSAIVAGLFLASYYRPLAVKRTFLAYLLAMLVLLAYHAVYARLHSRPGTYMYFINYANATDTYLGAILPSAQDPYQAAEILGLPASCVEHSGQTWYSPGIQDNHPCPAVLGVSRSRLLLLGLRQPGVLVNATSRGILLLRPWTLEYLGSVGGQQRGDASRFFFTFSGWLDEIPGGIMGGLFLLPSVAGVGAAIILFRRRHLAGVRCLAAVVISLALSLYVVFYSSLLGDGFFEFQKHNHLFFSLYLSLLIVLLAAVLGWAWQALRPPSDTSVLP